MKRLFVILFAALSIVSCKDEERVTLYEDMMYFTNKLSTGEVYISPVTALDANVNSLLSLHVVRNAFAAKDYPQQSVQIVVDRNLTTAEQGVDFSVSETNLTFNDQSNTAAPLSVDIHSGAGKIIALQLVGNGAKMSCSFLRFSGETRVVFSAIFCLFYLRSS